MSAITTWRCPNDGLEWALVYKKCPTCGYANMAAVVTLASDATKKSAEIGRTMKLGKAIFTQRFSDPDAKFAADEQFEIVRDVESVAWVVRPVVGARNPTYYNGEEVPPEGFELTSGGVITVGRSRLKLHVTLK
jgi:hypothetical protein